MKRFSPVKTPDFKGSLEASGSHTFGIVTPVSAVIDHHQGIALGHL